MAERRDPATIRDVALHARVSTATVSRVLAGIGKPRAEVVAAVQAAASELDYRRASLPMRFSDRHARTDLSHRIPRITTPMTLCSLARRRDVRLLVAIVVAAGVAGGGYGLWTIFLKPAGPAAVSASLLAGPSASAGSTAASPIASGTHQLVVNTSLGSFSDFTSSFVGYRVQEELASIGGNTAVGRTPDVSGTVTIEGMRVTAAEITADLTTLKSDDDRRDTQLRRQALETDRYPTATFSLTKPIELPAAAAKGAAVNVTATGDLTLHGVTKRVQIPLTARLETDRVVLIGSIEITFADYQMEKPNSFKVLSVADHGTLELHLLLTEA